MASQETALETIIPPVLSQETEEPYVPETPPTPPPALEPPFPTVENSEFVPPTPPTCDEKKESNKNVSDSDNEDVIGGTQVDSGDSSTRKRSVDNSDEFVPPTPPTPKSDKKESDNNLSDSDNEDVIGTQVDSDDSPTMKRSATTVAGLRSNKCCGAEKEVESSEKQLSKKQKVNE